MIWVKDLDGVQAYIQNSYLTKCISMTTFYENEKDKLISNLQAVINDTEELLRMTADHAGETAEGIRKRVTDRLNQAMDDLSDLQNVATDQAKAAVHATDEFVNHHPWKSVGIAAGIGLLVGLLVSRR